MARTKTKPAGRAKASTRPKATSAVALKRGVGKKTKQTFAKPYDAKKYQGSVPAFASVVAEEMKSWRDDR